MTLPPRTALSRALDLLERHQWAGWSDDERDYCPECKELNYPSKQHAPDCELAQLLTENGREVRYAD